MLALERATRDGRIDGRIVAVISDRADAAGLEAARRLGLETAALETAVRHASVAESTVAGLPAVLERAAPDSSRSRAYMRILDGGFVRQWQGRLLNIHPSLLPAYRGLHTHRRVLEAGEGRHGCTVHFVVEELDAGSRSHPGQARGRRGEDEAGLSARVQRLEHIIYPRAVGWFAAGRLDVPRRWRPAWTGARRARRSSRRSLKAMAIGLFALLAASAPLRPLRQTRSSLSSRSTTSATVAWRSARAAPNSPANGAGWALESTSTASGFARVIAAARSGSARSSSSSPDGPRPRRYRFDDGTKRTEPRRRRSSSTGSAGRVRGTAEDAPVDVATVAGLQDAASMQALVLARLRAGREPGTIAMIEKDKVK